MNDRNIRLVNRKDALEEIAAWQQSNEWTIISPGDNIQVGLSDPGSDIKEYLWVQVEEVDGDTIKGWVNNDTRLVRTINYQDKVIVQRSQIKNRIPGSSEIK